NLDGLHFDYIRYPYAVPLPSGPNRPRLDFGYGESARRFQQETGLNPSLAQQDPAVAEAWDGWRKRQISHFLRRLRPKVKRLNPKLLLSAALLPSADRAALALQDWPDWMAEGLLDLGIIMNYTKERGVAQTFSRQAVMLKGKGQIFVGLGTYLLDGPVLLLQQIQDAVASGADGVVLFSYDNLLKKEGLLERLREGLFQWRSQSPR
ncbi:MAG: family 10 glycosylhydrolase, partial [Candidatus Methylomirabilales bacterium]